MATTRVPDDIWTPIFSVPKKFGSQEIWSKNLVPAFSYGAQTSCFPYISGSKFLGNQNSKLKTDWKRMSLYK